jgi:TonB family protein
MINYLLEFAIIHMTLIGAYWLFLRNESQYGKMRFYLLGATALSMLIPLLKLPKLFINAFQSNEIVYIPINAVSINELTITPVEQSGFQVSWLLYPYLLVSFIFLIEFIRNFLFLFRLQQTSKQEIVNGTLIHRDLRVNGSFTFFQWVFISENTLEDQRNYSAIIEHEKAHVKLGHSFDLIFLELFKIAFWWLPTSWFAKKEIKKIHEYQADAFAVKTYSIDLYSSILISSTLRANGLSLASSFHDGLIFKRLKAMKQKAKNVSPWKMGAVTLLTMLLVVVFACSEDSKQENIDPPNATSGNDELFVVVETNPEFPGGNDALIAYLKSEIKYPAQARKLGVEGKVFVEFIVQSDGSLSNVQVLRGIGAGCDAEAIRVMQNSPNFTPGSQRGKKISVKIVLPILFKLGDEQATNDSEMEITYVEMKVKAEVSDGIWKGTVYNSETGAVMPGVNVIEEGTQFGTVSDLDGTFKLTLSDKSHDVVLSHVGYKSSRLTNSK